MNHGPEGTGIMIVHNSLSSLSLFLRGVHCTARQV
jgi:hypothetical protein